MRRRNAATLTRGDARREIVKRANEIRASWGTCPDAYTMRHIQRAVFCVRQSATAPPGLLGAAGFREARP